MNGIQLKRPIVFLDLETTGTNIRTDRIVEISVIKFSPDDTETEKTVRVNPEMAIPKDATDIHGITDQDVYAEPPFRRYSRAFLDFLNGCDIGGFNIFRFDLPLLQEEFKRSGMEWDIEGINIVDPMIIFHKKEPRNLMAAYRKYCGTDLEGAHQAVTDARAAKDILLGQIEYYDDIGKTIEELHMFCDPKNPDWIGNNGNLINTDEGIILGFGKYHGRLLSEVAATDHDYLNWILSQDFEPLVKDIINKAMPDSL